MVSLVLTMAGRYYPTRPAKMMGKMTLSYGAAQIIAPAVTGWLAGSLGSYAGGLYLAAAVMAVGTLLLLMLKFVERRDPGAEHCGRQSPSAALSKSYRRPTHGGG